MADSDSDGNCTISSIEGEYNMPVHIASIFILEAVSLIGASLPIAGKAFFKPSSLIFQCGKLFGAGVILATAWLHMLNESFENLSNPCLPSIFQDYSCWTAAIALAGLFITQCIQSYAGSALQHEDRVEVLSDIDLTYVEGRDDNYNKHYQSEKRVLIHEDIHPIDHSTTISEELFAHEDSDHHHALILNSKRIGVYMLEMGIASHSIIIGLALGTTRGEEEFTMLLAAICLHQFFEGIALASVILEAQFSQRKLAYIMVFCYSFTTPVGIAIGIAIHSFYNPDSIQTLITQGVLDALAAGILTFDGLVNIVQPHLRSKGFRRSSKFKKWIQFMSLWLGAAAMGVIGKWM